MAMISISEWKTTSLIGRTIAVVLGEQKIVELLKKEQAKSARINSVVCAHSQDLDRVVLNYVTNQADSQTAEGRKFAERTIDRNAAEKVLLIAGVCAVTALTAWDGTNPIIEMADNNQWCKRHVLQKRIDDIANKQQQRITSVSKAIDDARTNQATTNQTTP